MQLRKLEIERMAWGEDKGKFVANVVVDDGDGSNVTLKLPPGTSERLLPLVADEIDRAVSDAASEFRQKLYEATRLALPEVKTDA